MKPSAQGGETSGVTKTPENNPPELKVGLKPDPWLRPLPPGDANQTLKRHKVTTFPHKTTALCCKITNFVSFNFFVLKS